MEDLNVAGMAGNKPLAKSVADAGLGELQRQLEYKPLARPALRQARPLRRQHTDLLGVRPPARGQGKAGVIRPRLDLSALR